MKPPRNIKTKNTFYHYVNICPTNKKQYQINIFYYFNDRKIAKLFEQYTTGSNRTMWDHV